MHRLTTKAFYNKGEMVEWSITAVLKTAVPRGTGGSNPSLSAGSTLKKLQKTLHEISKYRSFFNELRYFCFIPTRFFRVRKEGAEFPLGTGKPRPPLLLIKHRE